MRYGHAFVGRGQICQFVDDLVSTSSPPCDHFVPNGYNLVITFEPLGDKLIKGANWSNRSRGTLWDHYFSDYNILPLLSFMSMFQAQYLFIWRRLNFLRVLSPFYWVLVVPVVDAAWHWCLWFHIWHIYFDLNCGYVNSKLLHAVNHWKDVDYIWL